jgi:hypothetical protein
VRRNERSSAKRIQEEKLRSTGRSHMPPRPRRAPRPHRETRRRPMQKGQGDPTISSSLSPTAREMPSRKREDETVLDRRTDERGKRERNGTIAEQLERGAVPDSGREKINSGHRSLVVPAALTRVRRLIERTAARECRRDEATPPSARPCRRPLARCPAASANTRRCSIGAPTSEPELRDESWTGRTCVSGRSVSVGTRDQAARAG